MTALKPGHVYRRLEDWDFDQGFSEQTAHSLKRGEWFMVLALVPWEPTEDAELRTSSKLFTILTPRVVGTICFSNEAEFDELN